MEQRANTLVLHVGAKDIVKRHRSALRTFDSYRDVLEFIRRERPDIQKTFITLLLPKTPNRHRGGANRRAMKRYNNEACLVNEWLREYCRRTLNVHFIDHGMELLPSFRVFAADGVHPSYEGVAVMTSHVNKLLLRNATRFTRECADHASDSAATAAVTGLLEFPELPQRPPQPQKDKLSFEIVGGARRKSPPRRPTPGAAAAEGPAALPAG